MPPTSASRWLCTSWGTRRTWCLFCSIYQLVVVTPLAMAGLDAATRTTRRLPLKVFLQPLRNPVTIACVLGLLLGLSGLALPEPVMRPVDLVAGIAVPAALLVFGMSLHGAPAPGGGDTGRMVWLAVFLKTVVQPAIAYVFALSCST